MLWEEGQEGYQAYKSYAGARIFLKPLASTNSSVAGEMFA